MKLVLAMEQMSGMFTNQAQVLVGGATIFVLNVEQFTRE